jgi:uncharacterized membrane protein (UPF0127 family)
MIRAATFTLGLLAASAASAACTDAAVDLRGDFGSARFNVEVADDPSERAQGLMNRPSMPASAGMLFLYDAPQRATFWMKNSLIPLDMIFLDQTGTVTRVHENAVPLDETTIDGGPGVVAVLEINGGLASAIGISEGSQLRHPGLDQSLAAWPCE